MAGTRSSASEEQTAEERGRAAHLGPERRRPLVLDAAFEVFLEKGYEGASMDEVAAAAGVSKPVVYACFSGKEELFQALLAREERRMMREIARAFPGAIDPEDPEALLREGLSAFLRGVVASPRAYRTMFLGEGANSAIADRVRRGREIQVEALANVIAPWLAQQKASDPDRNAQLIAYAVAGVAEAAARMVLQDPDRWTPDELGERLAGLIWRGRSGL